MNEIVSTWQVPRSDGRTVTASEDRLIAAATNMTGYSFVATSLPDPFSAIGDGL